MENQICYDSQGMILDSPAVVKFDIRGKSHVGNFTHITPKGDAYIKFNGKPYERRPNKIQIIKKVNDNSNGSDIEKEMKEHAEKIEKQMVSVNDKFNINERFDFLESLVRMTIRNRIVSLMITGEGGIGKTFTVMKEVRKTKMIEDEHFVIIKGYSTAKGLYKTLYEHREMLIIFDDCDEVFKNPTGENILKGALDSYSDRIVNWITSKEVDGELPPKFKFEGRIIFISNRKKSQIPQPILSRAACIDLTMSVDDKLQRMRNILPVIKKDIPMELKERALSIIEDNKDVCQDLNFRTLLKAISALSSEEANADKLTEFLILS